MDVTLFEVMVSASSRSTSPVTVAGLALVAVGTASLTFLIWRSFDSPAQPKAEEAVQVLDELVRTLDHDRLLVEAFVLPAPGNSSGRSHLATFRNLSAFWEPAFRAADKKMRRRR